jgi:hypothetical protein
VYFLEDRLMSASRKISNMTKYSLIHLLLAVSVLPLCPRWALASEKAPNRVDTKFLVLNDCDDDNKLSTAPHGDTVYMMDSHGRIIRMVALALTVTSKCSRFSISEDGRFFVVCDGSPNILAVYEVATGRKLWSLVGLFNSAVFVNDLIYASSIDSIYVIDHRGIIVKHTRIGAFDLTVDRSHNSLWTSGQQIKKCKLDLEPILTVGQVTGIEGPVFIEANSDGSIWLIQRDANEQPGSQNQLAKVSSEGKLLKTIRLDLCPYCMRVDSTNGSIWVTGKGYRDLSKIGDEFPETLDELYELAGRENCTKKYDSKGRLLFCINEGGHSLALDPFDGSVWIAGEKSIGHFSNSGKKLGAHTSVFGRKWLVPIPNG